jgi:hypothetical protein
MNREMDANRTEERTGIVRSGSWLIALRKECLIGSRPHGERIHGHHSLGSMIALAYEWD